MPSINMIAPRRMNKLRLEKKIRYLVLALLVEFVLVVVVGMGLSYKLWGTTVKTANYEAQLTELKAVVDEIEAYKSKTQELKPKLDLLNEAKDRTMSWYTMLDKMMETIPVNCHLNRISIHNTDTSSSDSGAKTQQITLVGVAPTQTKVGETMLRLQQVQELNNIELHFAQTPPGKDKHLVEFEIGAEFNSRSSK